MEYTEKTLNPRILVWAHRGASAYAPENTLPAFQMAVDMHADGVELDVHLSADGQLIVCHDGNIRRTSSGEGDIAKMTLAELREYSFNAGKEAFGFDFKPESFRINRQYSGMILSLGAPMAIQAGCINLSMLFVNSMINNVSVEASATFGVGVRIDDIINKISQGIQHAAMPIISQNIAARQQKRAVKTVHFAWLYSGILTVVFVSAYIFFGKELFMLFSDDPLVHEMSGTFIKAILWMFPALAVMRGSSAFIQGIGNAKLSMVLALLDGVVLRIGLSWLFGIYLGWGFYGFVLGYALAPFGCAIPGMSYFLSGLWKKQKVLADRI
jgi:Na+-driven multidrug efflux pump